MKKNGFTLIELMIVVAILAILGGVAFGGKNSNVEQRSYGINGITETRCISGYKFVVGQSGSAQQILNGSGHGIECDNQPGTLGK